MSERSSRRARTRPERGWTTLIGQQSAKHQYRFQVFNTSTQSGSPPALTPGGEKVLAPAFQNVPTSAYDPFVGSSQRAATDLAKVDMATVSALSLACGK